MSLIMHMFGFRPLRRTHFAIVGKHRRAAQADHPHCATITQTITRVFWTFPSSFRNQFPNVNAEFLPGCHRQNVPFSSSQAYLCLCQFLYKLERTLFASRSSCTAWRWSWCRSCFHGEGTNNGFRPQLSPRTWLALCFTASSGKPRHT